MKIGFFTDTHLGLRRSANTSAKSQELYREAMYYQAQTAIDELRKLGVEMIICLGDLFDQCYNDEATILQGYQIAAQCALTLAGNHDIPNRTDKVSSLELVQRMLKGKNMGEVVLSPDPGKAYFQVEGYEGSPDFVLIPHCLTQGIFEESIEKALVESEGGILLLHCNVGTGFGKVEDGGSSLWLTPDMQKRVCEKFDWVLVGHEHDPKFEDNLIVMGNTMPVTFGEMGERFVYVLDTDQPKEDQFSNYTIFDPAKACVETTADLLVETGGKVELVGTSFVDITGEVGATSHGAFARAVMTLWKTNPGLLAVRKNITLNKPAQASKALNDGIFPRTLPEIVRDSIQGTEFEAEFRELAGDPTE